MTKITKKEYQKAVKTIKKYSLQEAKSKTKKITKKITNKQMQKLADINEANIPIDKNGELQVKVNNNTAYIVDANAKMKGNKMKVLLDRQGNYFYYVKVERWW